MAKRLLILLAFLITASVEAQYQVVPMPLYTNANHTVLYMGTVPPGSVTPTNTPSPTNTFSPTPTFTPIPGQTLVVPVITIILTPGIYSLTVPSGTLYGILKGVAPGGGGGGSSNASANPTPGSAGGLLTVGGSPTPGVIAFGGNGGTSGAPAAGGNAFIGTGFFGIPISGGDGQGSFEDYNAGAGGGANGGQGGAGIYGGNGAGGETNGSGTSGKAGGGGGGGGVPNGVAGALTGSGGGAGAGFEVRIYPTPGTSIPVTMGSPGVGGGPGSGGFSGGNGGMPSLSAIWLNQ